MNSRTTHTRITMQSGSVTAGRAALADVFKSLPDGDYTVTISPARDILAAIDSIVTWHGGLSEVERDDPALLNTLNDKARLLATLNFHLAKEVTEAQQFATAESNALKSKMTRLVYEYCQQDIEAGKRANATAARARAEYETLELAKEAEMSLSLYRALKTHLEASKDVLRGMQMNHIPLLRGERHGN